MDLDDTLYEKIKNVTFIEEMNKTYNIKNDICDEEIEGVVLMDLIIDLLTNYLFSNNGYTVNFLYLFGTGHHDDPHYNALYKVIHNDTTYFVLLTIKGGSCSGCYSRVLENSFNSEPNKTITTNLNDILDLFQYKKTISIGKGYKFDNIVLVDEVTKVLQPT
jgi:hypothetical protein